MTIKEFRAMTKDYDYFRIADKNGEYLEMVFCNEDTEYDSMELIGIEPVIQVHLKGITLKIK